MDVFGPYIYSSGKFLFRFIGIRLYKEIIKNQEQETARDNLQFIGTSWDRVLSINVIMGESV